MFFVHLTSILVNAKEMGRLKPADLKVHKAQVNVVYLNSTFPPHSFFFYLTFIKKKDQETKSYF